MDTDGAGAVDTSAPIVKTVSDDADADSEREAESQQSKFGEEPTTSPTAHSERRGTCPLQPCECCLEKYLKKIYWLVGIFVSGRDAERLNTVHCFK